MYGRGLPRSRQRAVEISRPASMAMDPIVDQRVAGAGVEGDDIGGTRLTPWADPGDVADPAEVEHRTRFRKIGGERGVVERRERGALAAGSDVGAAEIGDDIDA